MDRVEHEVNKKAVQFAGILALCVIALALIGCAVNVNLPAKVEYIDRVEKMPVYEPLPDPSQIAVISDSDDWNDPEVRAKIVQSITELKRETLQLRAMVESHNRWAKDWNANVDRNSNR